MNELSEREYFEIGKTEKLPKRCPILDNCERRMWTLFMLGRDREEYPSNSEEECLKYLENEKRIEGLDPKKLLKMIGESPVLVESEKSAGFSYMCPEVLLFEKHRFMYNVPRIAASSGRFDSLNPEESGYYCQHYSECAEFSKYYFEIKHGKKVESVEFRNSFVYLMHNKTNGYYKIGKSNNPKFRERTLQSQEPDVELIAKWEVDSNEEKLLHKKFKDKRVRGEWFALDEEDVNYIEEYMNQILKK